jgi:L-seryl-tRNA(Ser) seleniumtransferase
MKIGKEEVMGVLAAVTYWAQHRMHENEISQWSQDLRVIATAVEQVPTVQTTLMPGSSARSPVPRLLIEWDPARIGLSGLGLRQQLLDRDPRIMLDDRGTTEDSVYILPFSLQPGEAHVVGAAVRMALANAPPPCPPAEAEPIMVEGSWDVRIAFADGEAKHKLVLEQDRMMVRGLHRALFETHPVSGTIAGNALSVRSLHPVEGTHLAYRFEGRVTGNQAKGLVYLGSSGQSAPGPLNQREYGTATWQGQRTSRKTCGV